MIRLRSFRLRASTFALWASADRSRYGGQVAASARQVGVIALMAAAILFGSSSPAFACPMCFGAEETSMIDGAKTGVMVMLAVVFAVQGAFVGFFLYLRKRARRIADIELDAEWSELQGASKTS